MAEDLEKVNMSKVSIIMPAYNAEKTISKSIESVQAQTYKNWELIITDDKSTDSTKNIIQKYAKEDLRVKYFSNNSDKSGAWAARNNSLKNVKGRYIAFLDSDDTWLPCKLQDQLVAMRSSGCSASHSAYYRVNKAGNYLGMKKAKKIVSYNDMLRKNHIGNLTGIYDVTKIGVVFQENVGHEDYDMWLRILQKTDSVGVQESCANYLVQPNSLSSNKLKAATWHYNILKKQPNVNRFKVYLLFICYCFSAIKARIL